jgi:hypothetical protein
MLVSGNLAKSGAEEDSCLKKWFLAIFQTNIHLFRELSVLRRANGGVILTGTWPVSTFPSAAA